MKVVPILFLALASQILLAADLPRPAEELSLGDCIRRSLNNDHDVLRASRHAEAAHAKASSEQSKFFPRVELGITGGIYHDRVAQPGDLSIPTVPRDRNAYNAQILVTQNIFSGFHRSASVRRFGAEERIAELDLEIAKEQSIEETIALYYGAQLYEKQIAVEKEVQGVREEQLKVVEHRMSKGAATDLQKLQAQYAVKQEIPKIQELEAQLSGKYLRLYRKLNVPLDGTYKLTDIIPSSATVIPYQTPPLAEAFDYALRHSLRVKKTEAELESVEGQSGEIFAKHLPSIDLDLNAGSSAFERQDIATTNSFVYGAQLNLRIPIFSGLDSFSDREQWRARVAELGERRAKVRETLLDDLNDTYRRIEMYTNRLEASRVNLDLTQRAVQRAEQSFKVGAVTLYEVLGAYSAQVGAKKQSNQDAYERILALFHVKALLGLGSKFDDGGA